MSEPKSKYFQVYCFFGTMTSCWIFKKRFLIEHCEMQKTKRILIMLFWKKTQNVFERKNFSKLFFDLRFGEYYLLLCHFFAVQFQKNKSKEPKLRIPASLKLSFFIKKMSPWRKNNLKNIFTETFNYLLYRDSVRRRHVQMKVC